MGSRAPASRFDSPLLILWICACSSGPAPNPAGGSGAQGGTEASGGSSQTGGSSGKHAGAGAPAGGNAGKGGTTAQSGATNGGDGGGIPSVDGGSSSSGRGGAGAVGAGAGVGGAGGSSDAGGSATAGSAGSMGGTGVPTGGTGGAAGAGLGPFTCPAPPYAASPVASGAVAERVAGVPPSDGFVTGSNNVDIIEGPVWLDGNLYVSEIDDGTPFGGPGFGGRGGGAAGGGGTASTDAPPARILKVDQAGTVSVAVADSGTNGLGLDGSGQLVGCRHTTGSVARFTLSGGAPVDLVSTYEGARFNSPNDLTFGADGTLYFTDPNHQAPAPAPQAARRAYRVAPGTTAAIPIGEGIDQPNGITLSPDRRTLYIASPNGVFSHPVMPDGSVGTSTRFAQGAVQSSDGMAVDCAGNLYTTAGRNVTVVSPAGTEIGSISVSDVQQVTNVAFGGPDRTTLYITALGSNGNSGLFRTTSQIPGMPY
jgi:gluconolactonase